MTKLEQQGRFPAVLFHKVEGFDRPILSNIHSSFNRMAIALDTTEAQLAEVYRKREQTLIPPRFVKKGPVKELVYLEDKVDLTKLLPALWYHEKDGGVYISLGCMTMKDPEMGHTNLGIYRLMIRNKREIGVYFAQTSQSYVIHKKHELAGKPMEVSIAIGHHPTFCIGAVANTSPGVNQYEVIGGVMGEPVELSKGEAIDIDVPAQAEIVIEGVIQPGVQELEGPFGEFTGTYGPQTMRPVINVKAVTMRSDAIFQDALSGHTENLILGYFARLNAIHNMVKHAVPTVKDIHMTLAGRCRIVCYISIKKMIEGEPKNASCAAFGADPFLRYAIVVDEDVDIRNDSDVLHAIAMRVRPDKDTFIVSRSKGSPLDPTAEEGHLVSKVGIDATRKPGYPEEIRVPGVEKVRLEDYL